MQESRACSDRVGQGQPVSQGLLDRQGQADSLFVGSTEGMLKLREETTPAWEGQAHAAKFTQEAMPFFDGHALAGLGICQ